MTINVKNKKKPFHLARYWTLTSLTAALVVLAVLLPAVSALSVNYWLNHDYNWRDAALQLGFACITLSLIAYPTYLLLNWEASLVRRWDQTQQDFKLLMDQAIDMVFLVQLDGRIAEANQRACESLGYSKKEFKQLSILDLDVNRYLHSNPQLLDNIQLGEKITYQTQYRTRSGNSIPVENRITLASWLAKPHYLEFVSDISHRLEVEKQIDESREALEKTRHILELKIAEHSSEIKRQKQGRKIAEQYASSMQNYLEKLLDSMPSVIIAVDEKYCIMQWNIESEKMTDLPASEVIGKNLSQLLPELYQQIQHAAVNRDLLQNNLSFQFKSEIKHQVRTLEVMVHPIFTLIEEEQGVVIRIDDITDKLKINETLVQTEKMLSLGGLAAGMAHEINNPLGAIMQTTQNIQRRLSDELERNQKVASECDIDLKHLKQYLQKQRIEEFLTAIVTSGERAANIVGDMLSFARPANKEAQLVSVHEALDAAVRLSAKDYDQRKKFDFRRIEIRKAYSPNIGMVMAQKNQLEQVFLNLLVNAAQALAQNTLSPPFIELIIRREGRMACVEVIDNGPGMEEETRKRVFEPFFTTKSEQTGTGLGLSVSYFIVCEQLGGELSVESQPGKGTRFTIHLPLALDEETQFQDEQIELPFEK